MVVVMRWKIGAIEEMSLIIFVGFAVDFCLHIAHKYHSCSIIAVGEEPLEEPLQSQQEQELGPANQEILDAQDRRSSLRRRRSTIGDAARRNTHIRASTG